LHFGPANAPSSFRFAHIQFLWPCLLTSFLRDPTISILLS
jgi:hypothetical protein